MPVTPEQRMEIERARGQRSTTNRVTVPALDEILHEPIPVLDHGFIRVIDYMGDDAAVVQAARVSYGRGTKKVSEDRGLIQYLLRHRHTTPFEMCEIKYHVKLPIFVARQWIRHRTASVNEYSARYSILDKEFYLPDLDYRQSRLLERQIEESLRHGQPDLFPVEPRPRDLAAQSRTNRQGRDDVLPSEEANQVLQSIKDESERDYKFYTKLLNEDAAGNVIDEKRHGLARELARMVLPANIYTQWYWKTNLHNLLHFLSLRADPHAQYEIRAYAEAMMDTLERWVPLTAEAFRQYRIGGAHLSANALAVVKRLIAHENVTQEESGMSKREWTELMETLGRQG